MCDLLNVNLSAVFFIAYGINVIYFIFAFRGIRGTDLSRGRQRGRGGGRGKSTERIEGGGREGKRESPQ